MAPGRFTPLHISAFSVGPEATLRELPSVRTVRLNGLGETTLLRDLAEYLSVLNRLGRRVEVIPNGTGALSDYQAIVEADGHVIISWDAAQPALFERLRRPARWAPLVHCLEEIAEAIAARGKGRCSLLFTLQRGNIGELQGVTALAARLKLSAVQMNVAKTPTNHWITDRFDAISTDVALAADVASGCLVELLTPAQIAGVALTPGSRTHVAASRCAAPWDEAVIRWNGDVQPCNMFNPYVNGNIHRRPFAEI